MKRYTGMEESRRELNRRQFVRLLQLAYSGEHGAAIAYDGHAAAVSDREERDRITQIRLQELDHRARVGSILRALGSGPDRLLELRNTCLGTAIAAFCHVGGWFLPMYGAGWIENRNIAEYERAARLAVLADEVHHTEELIRLAEVEWEHEQYFRLKAQSNRLARLLRVWRAPAPKEDIRRSFERFLRNQPRLTSTGWRARQPISLRFQHPPIR